MDFRLVLYHFRIANAHIHGFRIANSEEREKASLFQYTLEYS